MLEKRFTELVLDFIVLTAQLLILEHLFRNLAAEVGLIPMLQCWQAFECKIDPHIISPALFYHSVLQPLDLLLASIRQLQYWPLAHKMPALQLQRRALPGSWPQKLSFPTVPKHIREHRHPITITQSKERLTSSFCFRADSIFCGRETT